VGMIWVARGRPKAIYIFGQCFVAELAGLYAGCLTALNAQIKKKLPLWHMQERGMGSEPPTTAAYWHYLLPASRELNL